MLNHWHLLPFQNRFCVFFRVVPIMWITVVGYKDLTYSLATIVPLSTPSVSTHDPKHSTTLANRPWSFATLLSYPPILLFELLSCQCHELPQKQTPHSHQIGHAMVDVAAWLLGLPSYMEASRDQHAALPRRLHDGGFLCTMVASDLLS